MFSLLLLNAASAAPIARQQDVTLPQYCTNLFNTCAAQVTPDLQNVWSLTPCIAATTCFTTGTGSNVQTLLNDLTYSKNATAQAAVSLPRITDAAFNAIASDGNAISQQNWIDLIYGALSQSNPAVYPDSVNDIISSFNNIQSWTGFCNAGVPKMNIGDWLQYAPSTSFSGNCGAPATLPTVSSDPSCQTMFSNCVSSVQGDLSDFFNQPGCVRYATCAGGKRPVNDALAAVYSAKNGQGTPPASPNVARVPQTLYSTFTSGTLTQQNFIDAWYGYINQINGQYPTSVQLVIGYFTRLIEWTGQCSSDGVPYMNFADYYQYSSTVMGSGCPQTPTSSTSTSTSTSATGTPTPTYPAGDNGATSELFYQCEGAQGGDGKTVYQFSQCLLAAAAYPPNPDALITRIYNDDYLAPNTKYDAPILSVNQPRMSIDAFHNITGGQDSISQQAFIDATYNLLSNLVQYSGPPGAESPIGSRPSVYPASAQVVINWFSAIQAWTGYCGQSIPASNYADWLQYSSTVQGAQTSC